MADKKKRTLGDDLRDFRAGKIGDKFYRYNPVPFMVKTDDVKDTIPISTAKSTPLTNGLVNQKSNAVNNTKKIANTMVSMLNNPKTLAEKVKADTPPKAVHTVPSQDQYYQRLANVKNITTVPTKEQQFQYKSDVNTLNQIQQYQNKQKFDNTYGGYNYAQLKAEIAKTDSKTDKDLYSYLENKANEVATTNDLEKAREEELTAVDAEYKKEVLNGNTDIRLVYDKEEKKSEIRLKYEKLINDKKKKENYTDVVSNNIKVLTAIQKYHEAIQQDSPEQVTDTYSLQHGNLQNQKYTAEEIEAIKATYESYKEKGFDMDMLYEYYRRDLEEKKNAQRIESLKEFGQEHPVLGSVGSVVTNTFGSVGDAFMYLGAGLNKLGGGDGYIDPNSTAVAQAQAIRQGVSEKINNPLGEFLYNTGMSMADFLSVLPLSTIPGLGNAGITLLGTSAGVSSANEVINNGGDIAHALTTGVFAGGAEALFEYFSLEKLKALQSTSPSNINKVIRNALKQGIVEASEEALTELANGYSDWLINADLSNWSIQYNQHLEQGYSESTAWKMTASNFAKQVGLAAAGGFLSGNAIGSGASLISYGGYKLQQRDIENLKKKYNREVGEAALASEDFDLNNLIAQGKISGNKKAVKLAESIERTIANSGKDKITAGDVGNLMYLMSLDRPNNNYEVENTEKQEIINDNYTMGGVQKTEAVNATQQIAENKNSEKTTDAFGEAHPNGLSVKTRTGGTLTVLGIESSAKDFGASDNNVILVTDNGGKINADDVTPLLPHFQQLFNYAKNFDTIGAKNFVKEYESYLNNAKKSGKNASVEAYAKAFEDLYSLGKMGVTYDSVKESGAYESAISTLDGGIAYVATQAGNNDTNVTRQFEANKIQKIRVPGENNSINSRMYIEPGSESSVVASDEQLQILQAVAQKVGKDIVLTNKLVDDENGVSKNGMYDGDKIYIRADLNENYMLAVALHEATHDLRANSPFEYQALCNFIMNYLVSKGENVNSLLDNIKDNWKDNVSTEDDVLEELVCQTVMAIATDEKAINTVLNIKENKNILQKVASAFKKIAQYTYDFMKGIGFDRHNLQAQAWLDDAKAIQNLAEKLSSALDKNRNANTTQSEQQKNNTATKDDVKYSLNENAKTELHKALYDMNYRDEIRLRDETPPIMLAQKGVKNLPMTMKISHIRENVFTAKEAKQFGLRVDKYTHYHGLGENFYLQIIDELDNITEAYRGTKKADNPARSEKYFLLISKLKDKNGNVVNVPIYINEKSQCNRVFIDANKISTVFGRDNFQKYIKNQIAKGNLVRIKNRSSSSSERNALIAEGYRNTASNKRIPQDNSFVNNQSMRDTENNSSKSKSSVDDTIYIDTEYMKAVENDDMETAQRLVDEAAKKAGYSSNSDYQGTSAFNGSAPSRNGYFETKEDRLLAWENDEFEDTQTLGDFSKDSIDINDLDFFLNDGRAYRNTDIMHKQAISNLKNTVNEDKDTITMYRSVPSNVKESKFRNGDWITPSRLYAVENAKIHGWGEDYRIIEQEVSIENVWWDGNDIAEWGYDNGNDNEIYKNTENNVKLATVTYDDNGNVIPLSERFNDNQKDIRYSVDDTIYTDTEYMKAVENDDMETAQRLVDEAAKANGYTIRAYHGTTNQQEKSIWNDKTKSYDTEYKKFTVFKKQYDEQVGHFFNDEVDNAGGYGSILYSVYLKMNKPLVIDCNGQNYASIVFDGKEMDTYEWADYAKRNGYDGIIFKNISDGVGYDDLSKLTTDYVVFNSNQIKSADPVTYDDKGDVIPLSKRFINYSIDIRYSVDDTIIDFNDDWFLDEDLFFEGTEEHINFEKVIKDSPADALNIIYNTATKTAITGISQFKDVQLDYKAYTSIARKVMKDYGIIKKHNPDVEAKIANTIRKYAELIESGNYSDGADVIEKLVLECKGYIALSGDYDKTVLQEEREAILGYLSGKTLLITDYAEDFVRENYGNVAKYRRNMMGKVSVGLERNAKSMSNTMYMDDVISFVEENYPMFITDECDSVQGFQWLDNLLNNVLQPKYVNHYFDGFYENADTAAIEMAFDMTTEVISAKAKQLVTSEKADRKKVRELTKARKIAIAEREAMLKAKAESYKKQFQEERNKRIEQINKMRDNLNNAQNKSKEQKQQLLKKIARLEHLVATQKKTLNLSYESIREQYTEGRTRTIYRERLGRMLDRMVKKLDGKAKNNEYIPESLKGPIIEVLGSFVADPGEYKNGNKKTLPGYFGEWKRIAEVGDRVNELKDAYSKLKSDNVKNPDYAFIDINSLSYQEGTFKILNMLSEQVKNKNIYELNANDLQALYTTMTELDNSLKNAVEIILDGQRIAIKEAAEKGIAETESVKFRKGIDKFNNTALNAVASLPHDLRNSFIATQEDPVRYGRFLSGYHDDYVTAKIFKGLHEGDKNSIKIIQEAFLRVQAVTSKYSNKELKNLQKADIKQFNFKDLKTGKRVKISQGMLIAIALTDRQADGHRHLVNEQYNHYTVIPDLDMMNIGLDGYGDKSHKVRFSEDDIRVIKSYVENNKLLRELSGAVSEVYNTILSQHINEVSMQKYGMLIATVKDYYPLHIYKDGAKYEKNFEAEFNDIRLKSKGFVQNRIFSYAPIMIDDVLKTFVQHVKGTAEYCGLLIPIENFKKVYNSSNGDITLHEAIKEKFGTSAEHYIEKLMADLQRAPDILDNSIIQKAQGNFMGAKLLFNPGSALKQFAAYPTAYKYFGAANVTKASTIGIAQYKRLSEIYSKYTPYLWYRKEGNGTVVGELSRELGFSKKIRERADIMGKLDQVVVGSLLYAAELHVEQTTNLQRGTDAFYKEVARQFEKCIDETQPNNMLTSKPQFIRNNVMRILSLNAFRSQNMAIANTILDSFMEYSARRSDYKENKNSKTKEAKNEAKMKFVGSLVGATTSSMLIGAFNILATLFLWHKWEDFQDEEGEATFKTLTAKFLDYTLESLTGIFACGDTIYQAVSSLMQGEHFWGLEVMSIENINDLITKVSKGDFVAVAALIADCFGYPGENILKITRSISSYWTDLWNGRGDVITAKNTLGELNTDHFHYIIVRAKQNGETEKAEHFEDMWIDYLMNKKGKTKEQATETIKDKLVTALAVSDDDVELAAQAFANGDLETYETHLNKVIGYGFDSKDVKSAVDKVIKNIIADLKDKKITEKEDIIEDLKQQGFNDKGCEYIYNEMQSSTKEESEEVASVFADTSQDKGVAYTYSDAFEALKSGDKDNYNHIKNYLVEEAGKEEKDIQSAMRNASRTDPLWAEYIKAYEDNDGTKMREIKAMLTNIYGSWDTAVEAMHRYQKRMKEKENK